MNTMSNPWRFVGAALLSGALIAALGGVIWGYGETVGLIESLHKSFAFLLIAIITLLLYWGPRLFESLQRYSHREQYPADPRPHGCMPTFTCSTNSH